MTVTGQPPVSYGYDAADRLTSLTQAAVAVTVEHDDAGRRRRVTLPNGVATEYAYDAASQLTALTYRRGGVTLGDLTYTYDATGGRQSVGGTWARTGRPPSVATARYDAANQQQIFDTRVLAYDANGNLLHDGTTSYIWDVRDRLASIAGPVLGTFLYDGLGRRVSRTVDGKRTAYLHDGLNVIQEHTATGITSTLTGLAIDEHLVRTHEAGGEAIVIDALGSTVALMNDAGEPVGAYTYEPFGAVTVDGAATDNTSTYTGREDDGTGLLHYRARYYHPRLHRFIREDPHEFRGGDVNLYAYVRNDPLNHTDPLGQDVTISLWRCCWGFDHVGIGVGPGPQPTVGFYPTTLSLFPVRGVVDYDFLRKPFTDFKDEIVLRTTTEQDDLIRAYIAGRSKKPGMYSLAGRNCVMFVQDALRAAGIDPVHTIAGPRSFYELVQELHTGGTDFTQGITYVRP
jgi:RHS repeat-associated protein